MMPVMPVEQDTYAVLSLANIDFALAGAPDKLHEREERLKRACKCYRKVLDKDPSNQYAANGVGMVRCGETLGREEVLCAVLCAVACAVR